MFSCCFKNVELGHTSILVQYLYEEPNLLYILSLKSMTMFTDCKARSTVATVLDEQVWEDSPKHPIWSRAIRHPLFMVSLWVGTVCVLVPILEVVEAFVDQSTPPVRCTSLAVLLNGTRRAMNTEKIRRDSVGLERSWGYRETGIESNEANGKVECRKRSVFAKNHVFRNWHGSNGQSGRIIGDTGSEVPNGKCSAGTGRSP